MPVGYPSIRVQNNNPTHHLWNNNGTWWIHFTVHFDHRKRRIRRSLQTRLLAEAIDRRDHLLAQLERVGEVVPDRRTAASKRSTPASTQCPRFAQPSWPNGRTERHP